MTATPHPTTESTVIRSERYRVHFDSAQQAALCARVAGANRYVWNHMLADCIFRWRMWRSYRIGPRPSVSFITLCRRFTVLRNDPEHAWLRALPAAEVRYALKYLADAFARYFAADQAAKARGETLPRRRSDGRPLTFPRFKSRHGHTPGFTIPDRVRLDGARLHIPKVGWVRLQGSGLYRGCPPKQVRILKEGTEDHPKWYAHVFHEVPVDRLKPPAETGAVGVDRNVGQATDSDGTVYALPATDKLAANIKRKQRALSRKQGWGPQDRRPKSNRGRRVNGQLQKLQRKQKRKREDAAHQHSRKLADTAHTVVVEDLNTKAMTKSAKGTVAEPGRQVKQKAGLNRGILASNWGRLDHNLAYKTAALHRVNAAYTSQTCSVCGHVDKENRKTQATFKCVACGHSANADHNAALNILARAGLPSAPVSARGTGAAARRGAIPPGIPDDP